MPDLTARENQQVDRFLHLWGHATARRGKGLPEHETVHLCWGYPVDAPPEWAEQAAAAGEPSMTWCPILNPRLTEDHS